MPLISYLDGMSAGLELDSRATLAILFSDMMPEPSHALRNTTSSHLNGLT